MGQGRKRKPQEQKQKAKITVWLTEAEKQRLAERAGQLPISSYFRELLLKGRAPKQPPNIPTINWEAYQKLTGHLNILRQLSGQFEAHTMNEQAQAIAQHSQRIAEMLEAYRMSLIGLKHGGKEDDSQD